MAIQSWEQVHESYKQRIEETLNVTFDLFQNAPVDKVSDVVTQNGQTWISLKKEILNQENHGMPSRIVRQLVEFCDRGFITYSDKVEHFFDEA